MSRIPSPQNDKRACLCKDNKYSRKCCDGSLRSQGIGNITKSSYLILLESGGRMLQENKNILNLSNQYTIMLLHHISYHKLLHTFVFLNIMHPIITTNNILNKKEKRNNISKESN